MPNIAGLKTKNGVDYSSKVDKVTGYSLVSNQEITKLSSLSSYNDSSLRSQIDNKVDKITGYGLVSNDQITKLSSLSSYDDSSLRNSLIEQIEDSKSYPSLTFPIPFDEDNDVLKLLVDLSLTPSGFSMLDALETYNSYTLTTLNANDEITLSVARINMIDYYGQNAIDKNNVGKMKIINGNGELINIPTDGIGTPYYGSSICFKIDDSMFRMQNQSINIKHFQKGKMYYGRYTWIDSIGNIDQWRGFYFTYDVTLTKPIQTPQINNTPLEYQISLPTNDVTNTITIDYLNGEFQSVDMEKSSFGVDGGSLPLTINIDSRILNLPYGKHIKLLVRSAYQASEIRIEKNSAVIKRISFEQNNYKLLTIIHLDEIRIISNQIC